MSSWAVLETGQSMEPPSSAWTLWPSKGGVSNRVLVDSCSIYYQVGINLQTTTQPNRSAFWSCVACMPLFPTTRTSIWLDSNNEGMAGGALVLGVKKEGQMECILGLFGVGERNTMFLWDKRCAEYMTFFYTRKYIICLYLMLSVMKAVRNCVRYFSLSV